jgi:hypothetical protein
MPARFLLRTTEEKTYCYVYNKGIEDKIIFNDDHDFDTFLGYLSEYLSDQRESERTKQVFTVRGKTFQGTPHQPKNYYGKLELIGYRLTPQSFHLVLHQQEKGVVERFMRSLATRYSMYFNKKYQRKGMLFEGPYKSLIIKDSNQLLFSTRALHKNRDNTRSSYSEYIGEKNTAWVHPEPVLIHFSDEKQSALKGIYPYKQFIENTTLNDEEKSELEGFGFGEHNETFQLDILASSEDLLVAPIPQLYEQQQAVAPNSRFIEISALVLIFLILTSIGLYNIKISQAYTKHTHISATTETLGATTQEDTLPSAPETPQATPPVIGSVIVPNNSNTINIRLGPSLDTKRVGGAKNGDIFEIVSENDEWYEIELPDGYGYISKDYITVNETQSE